MEREGAIGFARVSASSLCSRTCVRKVLQAGLYRTSRQRDIVNAAGTNSRGGVVNLSRRRMEAFD